MAGKSLLIIEDDYSLAYMMSKALTGVGYEVKTAGDAIQGLTMARQTKPDLVILDFMCPGGGGKAVHRALRLSAHSAQTPIIILSAAVETVIMREIDYDGATYYLAKPYNWNALLEVLQQALSDGPAVA